MFWLPTVPEISRNVGWALAAVLTGWLVYAAGQYSMASLYLDARGDADWCVTLIEPALSGAERAASEAHRVSLTLAHYLDTPAPLPEIVAEVVQ